MSVSPNERTLLFVVILVIAQAFWSRANVLDGRRWWQNVRAPGQTVGARYYERIGLIVVVVGFAILLINARACGGLP